MKVVLFCGGLGMRIRDYSDHIPKPMVRSGTPDPLARDEVLRLLRAHRLHPVLGFGADVIKNYFLGYNECLSNDLCSPRRQGVAVAQQRHPRLADHLRRHRDLLQYRPAPQGCREVPGW